MSKFKKIILLIFIFFLLTRRGVYLLNPIPRGYDAGIYIATIRAFPNLPDWMKGGFSPGLFVFTRPLLGLGLDPQDLIVPLSILSQIALFVAIYKAVATNINKKAAIWAVFLFSISAIQFRSFWYIYIKHTFAIAWMLFALDEIARKRYIRATLWSLLVAFFHLPTTLYLAITFAISAVIDSTKRWAYVAILFTSLFPLFLYYAPTITKDIYPYLQALSHPTTAYGGAFYPLSISLLLISIYLLPAILGFIKLTPVLKSAFIAGLILVIGHFFFYQRLMINFDIFLLISAAVWLSQSKWAKQNKNFVAATYILFIILFVFRTHAPIITTQQFESIKSFGKTNFRGWVLATDKPDPAWLIGYTSNEIISWGYGANDIYWTNAQWEEFFTTPIITRKLQLLNLLPQPLFIYVGDAKNQKYSFLNNAPFFTKINQNFYSYTLATI